MPIPIHNPPNDIRLPLLQCFERILRVTRQIDHILLIDLILRFLELNPLPIPMVILKRRLHAVLESFVEGRDAEVDLVSRGSVVGIAASKLRGERDDFLERG